MLLVIPGMGERNGILATPSSANVNHGPSWAPQETSVL